ncbi:MAG: sulfurtransferase TusA family protein [Rhodospirillales bacterium]|jgi:TusA-related sulfurtransferase
MPRLNKHKSIQEIDFHLDITGEVCPLTFVKTKLLVERMQAGQVVEVRLAGAEPLENVPRSVAELGHTILSLEAEITGEALGVHRLRIRKEK